MSRLNFKTVADLNLAIVNNLHKLNRRKFDAVVGIPRSGMIAASLVATHLQKPLADVEGFCSGRIYKRFHTKIDAPRILLMDDTVNKGRAMAWAVETIRKHRPETKIIRAAVWHSANTTPDMVDFTFEFCPSPRAFQWNWLKHVRLEDWCFDFDGVLCRDPTGQENDDGPRYLKFIQTAEPLFLPIRPMGHIVTCRLEKYRAESEEWLRAHGLKWKQLHMMQYENKAERKQAGNRGAWKAEVMKSVGAELFIESNPGQASKIASITGLPVFCTTTQALAC